MKVLQIGKNNPSEFFGGIETVVKTFNESHIDNQDHVVTLVKGGESSTTNRAFGSNFFNIKRVFWLLFNVNRFDLIYVHIPNILALLPVLLFSRRAKIVCVYHSDVRKYSFIGRVYQYLTHILLEFVDSIYCSSVNFRNSSKTLLFYKDKCEVIPFTFYFESREEVDDGDYILMLARDTHYKGIDFAIKALKNTPHHVKVIGCNRSGVSNFSFYPNISEKEKWSLISGCKFVLMASTSQSESYGLVLVEAFSRGKSVVAPNLGTGVNYLVGEDERGLTYEASNKKSLLACVDRLSTDIDLRKTKELAVVEFYTHFLSYKIFKNKLINLVRKIVSI